MDAGVCHFDNLAVKNFTHFRHASDCFEVHWENDIAWRVLNDTISDAPVVLLRVPTSPDDQNVHLH